MLKNNEVRELILKLFEDGGGMFPKEVIEAVHKHDKDIPTKQIHNFLCNNLKSGVLLRNDEGRYYLKRKEEGVLDMELENKMISACRSELEEVCDKYMKSLENAFEKYDEILSSVKKNCKKDDLIIIALGPTASILAYELSEEYQALDMGHVDIEYEWYKMAVTEKVPVKNKHVNECNSMGDCEEAMLSKQYLKEIIDTIE